MWMFFFGQHCSRAELEALALRSVCPICSFLQGVYAKAEAAYKLCQESEKCSRP